ncbi:MAG: zf-HC2 domain-containing protein [Prolixibacteraceae bacterium]
MNCIDKIEIQKYIDNECSSYEKVSIAEHLSGCNSCNSNYLHQLEQSSSIKKDLNLLNSKRIEIPPFRTPTKTKFQRFENYIIYSLSAACLLLFVLIFVDKTDQKTEKQIAFNPTWEFDSNKPITEQALVISFVDPDGNRSEYYLQ